MSSRLVSRTIRPTKTLESLAESSRRASAQVSKYVSSARKRLSESWSQSSVRFDHKAVYVGIAAVFLLLVLVVVVSVVRTSAKASTRPSAVDVAAASRAPSVQVEACSSPSCADVSRRLLMSLSHETAPCANFYEFVCEGWRRRHPLREDKYQVSVLTEAQREVRQMLMVSLETSQIARKNQSQIDKLVALYRSCVGSLSRYGNSVRSMRGFFRLHGQPWPERSAPQLAELFDFLLELDIRWHLGVTFTYTMDTDERGRRVVSLYPSSPDRSVLQANVRAAYQSLITKMATIIGGEANYVDLVETVVRIDSLLVSRAPEGGSVAVPWTRIISVLPGTTYQMWLDPFDKYHANGKGIRSTDIVHIHSPHYFKAMLTLFLDNVSNGLSSWYLGWRVVQLLGCHTSHEFRSLPETQTLWPQGRCSALDVHSHCRSFGQRLMRPQWQGFVTKVLLSPDAVFDVLGVVKRVRGTLEDRLRHASWMDPATRVAAFAKLEALRETLPKFFVFDGKTPEYERYARLPDLSPSFVDNWLAVRQALGDTVDRRDNATTPSGDEELLQFEVSYVRSLNELLLNVDVLVRPVYSYGAPAAVNYGALGAMLGTELTHAFDYEGGQVDGVGKPDNWWSAETLRRYRIRQGCFASQLRKFLNDSADVGRLLHRLMAVSAGLRLAFFAHRAHESESGRRKTLRDVADMSSDQLLFVSFCFLHCHNVGTFAEVLDLRVGRRSLGQILCNGAVANMLEFAEAFGCPDDAKMNAPAKCRIW
ncbi:neprilysin-1-like [Ixodes scapularis]